MSVLSPVIDHLDLDTKHIYLLAGCREYHPVEDIYTEIRNLRRTDESLRVFDMPVRAEGAVPKGGGKYTPRYAIFTGGWRVVPENVDHSLYVTGEQITDDGQSGPACIDTSVITASVIIQYEPPAAEIIRDEDSLAAIRHIAFNGGVTFDAVNGYPGTGTAPNGMDIGTPMAPSNNIVDAGIIAYREGFETGYIRGSLTIDGTVSIEGFIFIGEGGERTDIAIEESALALDLTFYNSHVQGYLDGNTRLTDCLITDLYYVNGFIERCILSPGTIYLDGEAMAHFLDCWSGVPGTETPVIDLGGSGQSLAMRGYNGGIKLVNKTGPDAVSIDLASGQVKLDMDTVTAGTIVCRGVGKLINADTGEYIPTGTYGDLEIINELTCTPCIVDGVWGYER